MAMPADVLMVRRVEKQFNLIFKLLSIFSMTGVIPNQFKTVRKRRFELLHKLSILLMLWGYSGFLFYKLIAYYIFNKPSKIMEIFEEKYGDGSIAMYMIILVYTLRSSLTISLFGFLNRAKRMQVHLITVYEGRGRVVSNKVRDTLFQRQIVMCHLWFPCILAFGWSMFFGCVFGLRKGVTEDNFMAYIICAFVCLTYIIGICGCSTIYFCLMCMLTRDHYEEICGEFEALESHQEVEVQLCPLIDRHHNLCETLWEMDKFLSIYTFINYLLSIPESCAILYQMAIFSNLRTVLFCIGCFEAVNLTVISLSAAKVEESVRKPTTVVAKLTGVPGISALRKMQMVLFLEKLNGPEIGFSCWDFFVITRQTLLKIYGAVITYFLLLMQFRQTRS